MLSWIIQITIVSIILIFLVHHLINFFKSTLTIPKIKDLVNSPNQKYENMYNIIKSGSTSSNSNSNSNSNSSSSNYGSTTTDYTLIDLLPKQCDVNMKNELKNFLKKQMQTNDQLDTISSGPEYSSF
jgi:hypothetical protein